MRWLVSMMGKDLSVSPVRLVNRNEERARMIQKMSEYVEIWREDPVQFVIDQFDVSPSSQQSALLTAVAKDDAHVAVKSGHGTGKAQPVSLVVPTPSGDREWGSLQVGDELFGVSGSPVVIRGVYDQGEKPIYRVTLDDRSSTLATLDHLWAVQGRNGRREGKDSWETLTTAELIERGVKRKNGAVNTRCWKLPRHSSVILLEQELSIPPYVMGLWLGDGHKGRLYINSHDQGVVEEVRKLWPDCSLRGGNGYVSIYLRGILKHLNSYGLSDALSHTKHIPDLYLSSSREQRLELLRGLLDSDAEVDRRTGAISYSTTSPSLADDVIRLVRSMGGKAMRQPTPKSGWYIQDGVKTLCRDCYRITVSLDEPVLFRSERRQNRMKPSRQFRYLDRWIESIEPAGYSEHCRCVSVSAADGLYLTNDFIVTHNTTCLAWVMLWAVVCFPDVKVPCTAPTGHQLKDVLWSEVTKWRDRMLPLWRDEVTITNNEVRLDGTQNFSVARTGRKDRPEALQGMHATNMFFLIDEASGIDDAVFEVARGALSTRGARVVMAANPTRSTGYFYNAFHKNRDYWDLLTFSCEDSPHVSPKYVEEMESEYGRESDVFKVRVLGEFPSGGDLQFISTDAVNKAMGRYYRKEDFDFAPVILGCDVAWFGGDSSVIWLRQGLHARQLFRVQGCELATFAGKIAALEDEYGADAVFVDATGVGAGVVSNLRQMGRDPFPVMLGGSASNKAYYNKRAECWGLMRAWLTDEQGWIPDDDRMRDDLTGPYYGYDAAGKLQLERKQDMKKRGLHSPDDADALALTFAQPVVGKHDPEYFKGSTLVYRASSNTLDFAVHTAHDEMYITKTKR